jgi:hypothetical protein
MNTHTFDERIVFNVFFSLGQFLAGASLSAVGIAAIKKTQRTTEIPFAMIPLLFGLQQLTEGVIWLAFHHDAPLLKQPMTYLYSGFSHVLWPMYVPFAMGILGSGTLAQEGNLCVRSRGGRRWPLPALFHRDPPGSR